MIVPPNMWLHQHFNTGTTPARYLAFKHEVVSIRNAQGVPKAWISRRIGGDQIDYADETPEVRRTVRRGAGQARPHAADGRRLRGRARRPAAAAGPLGGVRQAHSRDTLLFRARASANPESSLCAKKCGSVKKAWIPGSGLTAGPGMTKPTSPRQAARRR